MTVLGSVGEAGKEFKKGDWVTVAGHEDEHTDGDENTWTDNGNSGWIEDK